MNLDLNKSLLEDKDTDNISAKLSYFDLVTINLRSNNRKITRNSFWMILSVLLYILVLFEEASLRKVSILFVTIENNILLLNLIPVFFAFIFFQNIALWNNNIHLYSIFEKLANQVFNLDLTSDTKNVVKPFSFTHQVLNYQYANKRIKGVFKLPIIVIFFAILLFPILFIIYSIYQIAVINTPSFIPIVCGVLTGIMGFSAVIQAFNAYKD